MEPWKLMSWPDGHQKPGKWVFETKIIKPLSKICEIVLIRYWAIDMEPSYQLLIYREEMWIHSLSSIDR